MSKPLLPHFSFSHSSISALVISISLATACTPMAKKHSVDAGPSPESIPTANETPGSKSFAPEDIDGKAYRINGDSVTAQSIISDGDSRHPIFIDANRVAYASRKANLERWQVFEADLAKGVERRVSFDAGDAEPVAVFGRRLVIASTSDEKKQGSRVLGKYLGSAKPDADTGPMQHLLLEHPASGRRGTEWVRMSREPAHHWIVSSDRDVKAGLALMLAADNAAQNIYRIAIVTKAREPETRAWYQLKVETPSKDAIVDGQLFPDGNRIVWSNGSILWTTDLKGKDLQRIGSESMPAAKSLTIDPSGQWIVFSSPTSSRGLNLMAIHRTGRCLKTLTELPGDEIEPVFSPDGQTLLFALKQGDSHVVARMAFGTTPQIAAACP